MSDGDGTGVGSNSEENDSGCKKRARAGTWVVSAVKELMAAGERDTNTAARGVRPTDFNRPRQRRVHRQRAGMLGATKFEDMVGAATPSTQSADWGSRRPRATSWSVPMSTGGRSWCPLASG